jgi:hypothetical protein
VSVGTKDTDTVNVYNIFKPEIYLGGLNDATPKSFSGYMKDVKLFSKFHDTP